MSIFVRKIDKAKWLQTDLHQNIDYSADAITSCLRTTQNTLSVWEVESETDIDEAVLAIISGPKYGHPFETIDIVLMSPNYLKEQGINCRRTNGSTLVDDLVEKHIDISNLTYKSLGMVAYHIVEKIKDEKVVRRTKAKLMEILNQAISRNRLNPDRLTDSIRETLGLTKRNIDVL
ncbi:MAG: hypothetical protein AAB116_02635 [Candidatus Poribacteria bacterium]